MTIEPSTSCTIVNLRRVSNDALFPVTFSHPSIRATPRRRINRTVRRSAEISFRSITCVLHLRPLPIVQPTGAGPRPRLRRWQDRSQVALSRKSSEGPATSFSRMRQCVSARMTRANARYGIAGSSSVQRCIRLAAACAEWRGYCHHRPWIKQWASMSFVRNLSARSTRAWKEARCHERLGTGAPQV